MALDREGFKDRLEEYLGGALREFYKAKLAIRNGETRWVAHWMREATDLIDRAAFVYSSKSIKGFRDRGRALAEVTSYLEKRDSSYRRTATNIVRRDFGGKRLRSVLTEIDTEEFLGSGRQDGRGRLKAGMD